MERNSIISFVLVVAISAMILPSSNAAQAKVSYCESDANYPVKVKSVDINPSPVISGQPATFTVYASAEKTIETGKVKIMVYFYGIYVHSEVKDLCSDTSCPIEEGSFVLKSSQSLPSFTPSGSYKLEMKMMDSDDKDLTCIKFNFKISHGSLVDVADN